MDIKIQKFPLLLWLVAAEKGRRSGEGGFDFAQLVTLGMTWE